METMKAVVFHGVDDIRVEEVPRPRPKAGEAVIRVTATTPVENPRTVPPRALSRSMDR
jgi:Alcohol dehydrogenase GroES-associated